MKHLFIFLAVLSVACSAYSQTKMFINKTTGTDSLWLSEIRNITFKTYACPRTVTYAGRTYNTVLIGTQCWLKENLNVGTMIQGTDTASKNGTIEKYCYNNMPAYCDTFGGLYQWNEAMEYSTTAGTQGICPSGWHIPTVDEFLTLASTVSNDGNALKAVGQGTGGGAGTNTSGFSALLAGARNYNGVFNYLGYGTYFWLSTEYNVTSAYFLYLEYNLSGLHGYNVSKGYGLSVRCLED